MRGRGPADPAVEGRAVTWLASVLVALGTIGASIAVARTDPSVAGWTAAWQVQVPLLVASLLVIVVGVVLLRRARRGEAREEAGPGGSLSRAREGLEEAARGVADLARRTGGGAAGPAGGAAKSAGGGSAAAGGADVGELEALHRALDELLTGPVTEFVENRGAVSDRFGMARYGEVMGAFARGERYLNRAWSASVDGYRDEAETYVRRAVEPLEEARRRLREGA